MNINDDYLNIYNCPNNKRIFYNTYNFNFLKPIIITANNNKSYPIDIFNFYRQEYLPFLIQENQNKIKIIYKKRLLCYFNLLYSLNSNKTLVKYIFCQFKKSIKTTKDFYINFINKKRLLCYFNLLYSLNSNKTLIEVKKTKKINKEIHNEFNNNSYYNDLIEIFECDDDDEVKPLVSKETDRINNNAIAALLLKLL